jgi:hypothetical protein
MSQAGITAIDHLANLLAHSYPLLWLEVCHQLAASQRDNSHFYEVDNSGSLGWIESSQKKDRQYYKIQKIPYVSILRVHVFDPLLGDKFGDIDRSGWRGTT